MENIKKDYIFKGYKSGKAIIAKRCGECKRLHIAILEPKEYENETDWINSICGFCYESKFGRLD